MKYRIFLISARTKACLATIILLNILFLQISAQPYLPSGKAQRFYSEIPDTAIKKIEIAIPPSGYIRNIVPGKLLVFNLDVWDKKPQAGHPSISYANYAILRMGEKTGAYETFFSSDTMVFKQEYLDKFDAICFNNTAGVLFDDSVLRRNLLDFIYSGKGFIGIHAAGATFCQWPDYDQFPEYGEMLGGYENGGHPWKANEWITVKVDDPDHPVNKAFKHEYFKVSDEVFQFTEPYTRSRLRILLTIDTVGTDWSVNRRILPERRADKDIAISWVRNYGRGRVFYTSLGHNPHINWDPEILQHYFDGILFAIGSLPAPVIPSNKLTPALKAQEKLGWRFGISASSFKNKTLYETIDQAATLGVLYLEGSNTQKVSSDIQKDFDYNLSDYELLQIRKKFLSSGITLVNYYVRDIPRDEETCKKLFEFGRKMGIEAFISEPQPDALDMIEKYCIKYNIKLAIHNFWEDVTCFYWDPQSILTACKSRSPLIGACGDFGYWIRSGMQPINAITLLKDRLITIQMHDLNEKSPHAHDVPLGDGIIKFDNIFRYLEDEDLKPVLLGLEYSYNLDNPLPEIQKSIDFFNIKVQELVASVPK